MALTKIAERVQKGRLSGQDEIGLRVGRVINQYKMAKHFTLTITDTSFTYERKRDAIAAEAALDGIYVIRTMSVDCRAARSWGLSIPHGPPGTHTSAGTFLRVSKRLVDGVKVAGFASFQSANGGSFTSTQIVSTSTKQRDLGLELSDTF